MFNARVTAAALAAAMLVGAPALAQDNAMASHDAMMSSHMTKSQMAMMNKCQAMSHDKMMKSRSCAKMMKIHPDMMKSGG